MGIGFFYFDYTILLNFFLNQPAFQVVLQLLAIVGWLPLVYLLIYAMVELWQEYRQDLYTQNWKWVLLAVDIPPLNVQTPKAVEQMFSHLAGAFDEPNVYSKFWEGYRQRWFSLEIISIEGYIQFLVFTEEYFRDLVEAAIYAQYPDAEITEVEDYTKTVPDRFPNDEYNIWAADFTLTEGDAYPLRTYREFEHAISKDTVLKDPMGTFLESFSRLGPGEQMWFQIVVEPTSNHWKEKVIKKIKELIGEKTKGQGGSKVADFLTEQPIKLLETIGDQVFGREESFGKKEEKAGEPNLIRYLTPGQSKLVEAMEDKIAKIGFKTKMRGIYLARQEVFNPQRGVNALLGAIQQFNIPTANSLAPTYTTTVYYFFRKWRAAYRKNLLMKAYKKRKHKAGKTPFVLNIEELATVWHFPMSHVKTPQVQKAAVKQAEPPMGLPIESVLSPAPTKLEAKQEKKFITDAGIGYEKEQRFG